MARIGRPGLSDESKEEVWARWKKGESLSEIGRAIGKHPGSIYGVISARGGFAPRRRTRSTRSLSTEEREEISRGVAAGRSIREIASIIGRSPSTVSRELNRNGGRQEYRAADADRRAWNRARRPRLCRLELDATLRRVVTSKLQLDWSPEQISGWLKVEHAEDDSMRISHEAIYRALFVRPRGVLEKKLAKGLRTRRTMRRSRRSTTKRQPRGGIIGAVPINERPKEVEDREVVGHWEGDLVSGSNNSHIATLVERSSRLTVLVKVGSKDTASVVSALIRKIRLLPTHLRKSLTWDRGSEMASHATLTKKTGMPVFFCDPRSPWQRGSNENTNRLVRQYLPKGMDLSGQSQSDLNVLARKLNRRPRKILGFRCPANVALID